MCRPYFSYIIQPLTCWLEARQDLKPKTRRINANCGRPKTKLLNLMQIQNIRSIFEDPTTLSFVIELLRWIRKQYVPWEVFIYSSVKLNNIPEYYSSVPKLYFLRPKIKNENIDWSINNYPRSEVFRNNQINQKLSLTWTLRYKSSLGELLKRLVVRHSVRK